MLTPPFADRNADVLSVRGIVLRNKAGGRRNANKDRIVMNPNETTERETDDSPTNSNRSGRRRRANE